MVVVDFVRSLRKGLVVSLVVLSVAVFAEPGETPRLYDPGPDLTTEEGKAIAEHFASIPNIHGIGLELFPGKGKARFAFGPTDYRGNLGHNQVKVLVIGQDGTHIAEAARVPFVSGTGGRLEHVKNYIGNATSHLFINTYTYTINGQVSDRAPVLVNPETDREKVVWKSFLSPEGYLNGQDPRNPYVQWRNELIDQIIKNNPDSLRLIITVGGAAKDTLSTYVRSRGGDVSPILTPAGASELQMVNYQSRWAGGNSSFYFPVDSEGNNLLLKRGETSADYTKSEVQRLHQQRANTPDRIERLVRNTGGPHHNGIYDLGQFGYDIDTLNVLGKARSLEGLELPGGARVGDVRVVSLPHPGGVVGGKSADSFARDFQKELDRLVAFAAQGWEFPPDPGQTNHLFAGEKFTYGRAPIPSGDSQHGITQSVMADVAAASRPEFDTIEFGSRDRGRYDKEAIALARASQPHSPASIAPGDIPWEPSRTQPHVFDPGPPQSWAEHFASLPLETIFEPKEGMTLKKDGIAALNVKSAPNHKAFAFYRGTFNQPEVLVLADPADLNDLIASRAHTGARGQRLQGFLEGLGAADKSLILKTLPFDMTDATDAEWKTVLEQTKQWREAMIRKALTEGGPKLILADGPWAESLLREMRAAEGNPLNGVPVVSLNEGYGRAFSRIRQLKDWRDRPLTHVTESRDIPQGHLPYGMQVWVGTGGDHVVRSTGPLAGQNYRWIVPEWVTKTPVPELNAAETTFLQEARRDLVEQGIVSPDSPLLAKFDCRGNYGRLK